MGEKVCVLLCSVTENQTKERMESIMKSLAIPVSNINSFHPHIKGRSYNKLLNAQ